MSSFGPRLVCESCISHKAFFFFLIAWQNIPSWLPISLTFLRLGGFILKIKYSSHTVRTLLKVWQDCTSCSWLLPVLPCWWFISLYKSKVNWTLAVRQSGNYYMSTWYVNAFNTSTFERTGPLLGNLARQWGFDCGENIVSEIKQTQ